MIMEIKTINSNKYNSQELASSIVKNSSKHTYYTISLLADKNLVSSCFMAYAYFRWVDDVVDDSNKTPSEIISFITRQRDLIDLFYNGGKPDTISEKEMMLFHIINEDKEEDSFLQSYIRNFFAIIEFDSTRRNKIISEEKFAWYSQTLGKAVTDCIFYFIGNNYNYPESKRRYLAAEGAHITHMLRDYIDDISNNYFNIAKEFLDRYNIKPDSIDTQVFQQWVKDRVILARFYFKEGKKYINKLRCLRTKIAAHWYCIRFEVILDKIEKDRFLLCRKYNAHKRPSILLKMAWTAFKVSIKHLSVNVNNH